MENPIKMDDLGVPLFSETPLYIYISYSNMLIFQPVVLVDPWRANRLTSTLRKAKHTNGAEHPKRQILNNHVLVASHGSNRQQDNKNKGKVNIQKGIPFPKSGKRFLLDMCIWFW